MARDVESTRMGHAPPLEIDRVIAPPISRPVLPQAEGADVVTPRDRLRWGPIWGGLIAAISLFLVLELLMYGFGWLTIDFTGRDATGTGDAWVSTLMALIAFFVGGWVAQATSSVRGADAGALHGFMVWALGVGVILIFSTLGLGLAFGPVGAVLNRLSGIASGNLRPGAVEGAVRDATLWSVLFLIVAAGAATVGGLLGDKKPDDPIGHVVADEDHDNQRS